MRLTPEFTTGMQKISSKENEENYNKANPWEFYIKCDYLLLVPFNIIYVRTINPVPYSFIHWVNALVSDIWTSSLHKCLKKPKIK